MKFKWNECKEIVIKFDWIHKIQWISGISQLIEKCIVCTPIHWQQQQNLVQSLIKTFFANFYAKSQYFWKGSQKKIEFSRVTKGLKFHNLIKLAKISYLTFESQF